MRIALVHDYLVQYGGAERVVEALHEVFPEAPVYTSMYEPTALPESFAAMDVRTTFMQRSPALRRRFRLGLPLYPAAMQTLDLRGYDVVVSSSSGWAHGVRTDPRARHLVYCHTPARWLYRSDSYGIAERIAAAPALALLRRWDRRAAARATEYVANSRTTRRRIFARYGRAARVIHPPVETSRFSVAAPDDYFLCASRLLGYKRIDLAIAACRRLGARLVVAGDGPARAALEQLAGPETTFIGHVDDAELADLMARCRAFVVPAEEDFCIAAVEAMAAGRPVVGYARGGLLETVVPGRTGILFETQTADALADALAQADSLPVEAARIRAHALRFDVSRFQAAMADLVTPTRLAA